MITSGTPALPTRSGLAASRESCGVVTTPRAPAREIVGWAMFDFANSSYTTVHGCQSLASNAHVGLRRNKRFDLQGCTLP
jgi:hypothetical protein